MKIKDLSFILAEQKHRILLNIIKEVNICVSVS